MCTTDTECVDNADCLPQKDKQNKTDPNGDKVCTCQEGFVEMGWQCSGMNLFKLVNISFLLKTETIFLSNDV